MSSELRAAELRMQDLVSELDQRDEALHRTSLERDDLRRVVGGLDAERDGLQAELDSKAEQVRRWGSRRWYRALGLRLSFKDERVSEDQPN